MCFLFPAISVDTFLHCREKPEASKYLLPVRYSHYEIIQARIHRDVLLKFRKTVLLLPNFFLINIFLSKLQRLSGHTTFTREKRRVMLFCTREVTVPKHCFI